MAAPKRFTSAPRETWAGQGDRGDRAQAGDPVLVHAQLTEDYAHQQLSLTGKKLRRLEITARAPKNIRRAAGVWSTSDLMRVAERELAEQRRVLRTDGHRLTGRRAREESRRGRDTGARINQALEGQSRVADHKLLTSALCFVSHPRTPTT
jgi:hypothetical protein